MMKNSIPPQTALLKQDSSQPGYGTTSINTIDVTPDESSAIDHNDEVRTYSFYDNDDIESSSSDEQLSLHAESDDEVGLFIPKKGTLLQRAISRATGFMVHDLSIPILLQHGLPKLHGNDNNLGCCSKRTLKALVKDSVFRTYVPLGSVQTRESFSYRPAGELVEEFKERGFYEDNMVYMGETDYSARPHWTCHGVMAYDHFVSGMKTTFTRLWPLTLATFISIDGVRLLRQTSYGATFPKFLAGTSVLQTSLSCQLSTDLLFSPEHWIPSTLILMAPLLIGGFNVAFRALYRHCDLTRWDNPTEKIVMDYFQRDRKYLITDTLSWLWPQSKIHRQMHAMRFRLQWDGRLTYADRAKFIDRLMNVALEGRGLTQLTAIKYLGDILATTQGDAYHLLGPQKKDELPIYTRTSKLSHQQQLNKIEARLQYLARTGGYKARSLPRRWVAAWGLMRAKVPFSVLFAMGMILLTALERGIGLYSAFHFYWTFFHNKVAHVAHLEQQLNECQQHHWDFPFIADVGDYHCVCGDEDYVKKGILDTPDRCYEGILTQDKATPAKRVAKIHRRLVQRPKGHLTRVDDIPDEFTQGDDVPFIALLGNTTQASQGHLTAFKLIRASENKEPLSVTKANALGDFFKKTSCESIELDGTNLKETAASSVFQGLNGTQPALKRLSIVGTECGQAGANTLGSVLPHCPQLKELDTAYAQIPDAGLPPLMQGVCKTPQISQWSLRGNLFTDSAFTYIGSALPSCAIKIFDISNMPTITLNGWIGLMPGLANGTVTTLKVENNGLNSLKLSFLAPNFQAIPELNKLILNGNIQSDSAGLKSVLSKLSSSRTQGLGLSAMGLTDDMVVDLQPGLARFQLTSLDLSHNHGVGPALPTLANTTANMPLEDIDLTDVGGSDPDFGPWFANMNQAERRYSSCLVGANSITDAIATDAATFLCHCETVDVSRNRQLGSGFVSALSECLPSSSVINLKIGGLAAETDYQPLFKAIPSSLVRHLDVSHTASVADSAETLAENLVRDVPDKAQFRHRKPSLDGARWLWSHGRANTPLETLDVSHGNLTTNDARQLCLFARRSNIQVNLENNPMNTQALNLMLCGDTRFSLTSTNEANFLAATDTTTTNQLKPASALIMLGPFALGLLIAVVVLAMLMAGSYLYLRYIKRESTTEAFERARLRREMRNGLETGDTTLSDHYSSNGFFAPPRFPRSQSFIYENQSLDETPTVVTSTRIVNKG